MRAYHASWLRWGSASFVALAGCSGAAISPLFEDGGPLSISPETPDDSGSTPAPFACGAETCQPNEYCRVATQSMCRIVPLACAIPATCACVQAQAKGQGGQGPGGPDQGCNNATCDDTDGQIRLTCK